MPDETAANSAPANRIENRNVEWLKPTQFQPGQSGNPSGRPKKKPITEMYEQMLEDPEFIQQFKESVKKAVRKGQMAMVLQAKEMAERVEGKVSQSVEVSGELRLSLSERMQKARARKSNHNG